MIYHIPTALEYLCLRKFMNNNVVADWENSGVQGPKSFWYSNNEKDTLDLTKVKERLTELEREIIKEYIIED